MTNADRPLDKILDNRHHIHLIGIGGSGMYPLAQILHKKGFLLTGSDNNRTETLDAVESLGIRVFMGQAAENIAGADLIVYSAAIMADNPELVAAKASGVPVLERSELLGLVTSWYSDAVCISGTHGKTTATSMLTQIFLEEGVDLSCVIGGKLPSIGGSGRAGTSDVMVCEACEFVDTFLHLFPDVSVILNIDADHLDYFKTLDNIIRSFRKFAENASKAIVYNGDDENTKKAVAGITGKEFVTFGFGADNDICAKIVTVDGLRTDFDLITDGEAHRLSIYVPGKHNVLNAAAAAACARYCGVSWNGIALGLQVFRGAIRRFQKIAEVRGVTIVDDYAHHPAEIAATLTAAKQDEATRVWAVFQPFTYSRTELLLDNFAEALGIADRVVLTDIMGSREKNLNHTYTRVLGEKIPGAVWFDAPDAVVDEQSAARKEENFTEIAQYLAANVAPGDLVITMGCGDVYKLAKKLAGMLA
ncbi:MAG: UDP-N-acetylmuramate--L-alanine ligase [Oscillospiraceae bacterium]